MLSSPPQHFCANSACRQLNDVWPGYSWASLDYYRGLPSSRGRGKDKDPLNKGAPHTRGDHQTCGPSHSGQAGACTAEGSGGKHTAAHEVGKVIACSGGPSVCGHSCGEGMPLPL